MAPRAPGGAAIIHPAILEAPILRGISMTHHSASADCRVAVPPIWSGLPRDLQQRTVRLLAQLAYVQVRAQGPSSGKETIHDPTPHQRQDSPRSS
jgi:hypothetical protein